MLTLFDKRYGFLALLVLLMVIFAPVASFAQAESTTCTKLSDLAIKIDPASPNDEPGIVTNISTYIKDVAMEATVNLYYAFTDSDAYRNAVYAAAALMITFYAVAFMFGILPLSGGEALKRLIRLGLIFTLISPDGWDFFSSTVVKFFNDGTDEIVGTVIGIGTGIPYTPGESPFLIIDGVASYVISADFFIAAMAIIGGGGPYGAAIGMLLTFAIYQFGKLLIEALKLYAISFIVRALVLGVAPVFFAFLLFDKTRPMFMGWVNTLLATMLQPILFFTFISFFLVMIMGATAGVFNDQEACWAPKQLKSGSANPQSFWRLKNPGDAFPESSRKGWRGSFDCLITGEQCPETDINILDLLTFVILVYVAMSFSDVVRRIGDEIANVSLNMSTSNKMLEKATSKGGSSSLSKNEGVP